MEEYFITRYKTKYPICHESNPECKNFKPLGCAWYTPEMGWDTIVCLRKIRKNTLRNFEEMNETSFPLEDCEHFPNCGGERRYCRKESCKKTKQVPYYRFSIGVFDDAGKKLFLTLSEIETHRDFRLAPESKLTATTEKKRKHIRLLKRYDDVARQNRDRRNKDMKVIQDYKQVAAVVQKKMNSTDNAGTTGSPKGKKTTRFPKGETAEDILRQFYIDNSECQSWSAPKIAKAVGGTSDPEEIKKIADAFRQTGIWKYYSNVRKDIREENKRIYQQNNEWLSDDDRKKLGKKSDDFESNFGCEDE